MSKDKIKNIGVAISPCTNNCSVDERNASCRSCGRSLEEIAKWSKLSDTDRRKIMDILPARLEKSYKTIS